MPARRILARLLPALLAAVAVSPRLSASVPAGGCGSCSGADRVEVAFRASAALASGGTVTITLADVSATGSGGPGPVSTTTGLAALPPETVVDGAITVASPALSCGLNLQVSADFVPSVGCGQTAEIRTKLPDETSFSPWSANLHPKWTYFSGAAPITIGFQLRILRADPGIAAAPPAISETSPPTLAGDGNGGLQPSLPSFSSRIPLDGAPGSGPFNAGSLVLSGPLDASLASLSNLAARDPLGLLTVHSTGSNPPVPTRIFSATRLFDIEEMTDDGSPEGFQIRVFEAGDFTPQGPASGASSSVTHRFRPVAGGLTVETTRRASPAMESATRGRHRARAGLVQLCGQGQARSAEWHGDPQHRAHRV